MPTIAQLKALLADAPNDTFLLYGLAIEHAKAGQTDEACTLYDRVIALDPHYCYAYYHKAKALEADDRVDEALQTVRAGAEAAKEANDAQAMNELAALLDELTP